ncbi:hypothetical protein C0J52_25117 [Blattella germanica]|nr:hypothetical protein C0J52_25117 [Blattella germanica]
MGSRYESLPVKQPRSKIFYLEAVTGERMRSVSYTHPVKQPRSKIFYLEAVTETRGFRVKLDLFVTNLNEEEFCSAFAVETFGPWCKDAKDLVFQLGRRLLSTSGDPRCLDFKALERRRNKRHHE